MAIVTSILTGGVNNHETTSEEANGVYTDFVNEGVVGTVGNTSGVAPATGNFAVNAQGTPDMTVEVGSGVAYVTGTPTSQGSQTFRVKSSAAENVTISANSSGSTKYDWVYIKLDATNLNAPNTAGDNVATLVTSRSSSANSDDGTPPTYGYPIAVVTVANGATSITNGNIRDLRAQVILDTGASNPAGGWTAINSTPDTITALGNRSYTVRFPSVDLTSTVSNGMRLKLTRTVTAPTQCADLESGSSQYFSKSSPSGMTFTDDFTCMGWVKIESYTLGTVIGRYSTNGFLFRINASGQVELYGESGGASRNVTSYQSIPLNKWVHVAASLDMSTGTGLTYIDGVLVPSVMSGAATAITQSGNLTVGSTSGSANFFDGKIAQAAVFSAILSASTIRSYISQGLTGSETSLAAGYSFNNDITDLSSNNNDLTAQNSAVATATDSPFSGGSGGTTEYAIITANTFSTNTTLTVQVPEGYAIPTSGGVSAVSYSTQKVPYGFPADRGRWLVESLVKVTFTQSSPTVGTWYHTNQTLTVPIGAWILGFQGPFGGYKTAATSSEFYITLSDANNSESDSNYSIWTNSEGASGTMAARETANRQRYYETSSAVTKYLNVKSAVASANAVNTYGTQAPIFIIAECAYV